MKLIKLLVRVCRLEVHEQHALVAMNPAQEAAADVEEDVGSERDKVEAHHAHVGSYLQPLNPPWRGGAGAGRCMVQDAELDLLVGTWREIRHREQPFFMSSHPLTHG